MKAGYILRVRYFLAHNKIRVVLCQLAFLVVSSFILIPVVFRGFYLAIKLSGYSSVTKENFRCSGKTGNDHIYAAFDRIAHGVHVIEPYDVCCAV